MMYIANIGEEDLKEPNKNPHLLALQKKVEEEKVSLIILCGKVEAELITLSEDDRKEFLSLFNLKEPSLHSMIREGFKLLGLINFFTAGPKEARAWTIKKGITAKEAAGEIHSDIERGFICAEVIAFEDYLKVENFQKAKENGLLRLEGKEYKIKDGDIVYFRFNVS